MKNKLTTIQEWAETKSFSSLNPSQKEYVLETMTKEEYSEIFETNQKINSFLKMEAEQLKPEPTSLSVLISAQEMKKKKAPITRLWSYPIPFHTAMAACLAIFALAFILFYQKPVDTPSGELAVEKIRLVRDTIYIKEETKQAPIEYVQVSTTPSNRPDAKLISTSFTPEKPVENVIPTQVPSGMGVSKSYGNSSVDQALLEQFKVRM